MAVYMVTDFATSVVNFAGNLPEDATMGSISLKHWLIFGGSTIGSLGIMFKTFTSSAWTSASKQSSEGPRAAAPITPNPM
jgi:hypothetical protein